MFILIVGRGCPSHKYLLNGLFEFDQAKALSLTESKIVYLSIDLRSIRRWRNWGIQQYTKEGVEVFDLNFPCGRIPNCLLHNIGIFAFSRAYKKIISQYGKPDIVHAHFWRNGFFVAKNMNQFDIKLVITEHLSKIHLEEIPKKIREYALFAYRKSSLLIAVSPSLAKNISKKFNINSVYIPNVIDASLFQNIQKRKHEGFLIISVGSLTSEKRMDLLIKSFAQFKKWNLDTRLFIFGEGPERQKIQKLIIDLDLEDSVILYGICPREVIAEKMKECDLFVLVSQAETFGVSYVEAMAAGLPVIATKCGGPEAFVNQSNGLLIEKDDLEATTKAIQYMYDNLNKYNVAEIAKIASTQFSPNSVSTQLLDYYDTIINHSR